MQSYFSLDRLRFWGLKGGLSLVDQGVFSTANFVVNVLLARWLPPVQYGGYSVAYSTFLLIAVLQVALIAEPMSIFGVSKYSDSVSGYLNRLIRIQWLGSVALAVLVAATALLISDSQIREPQVAMALSMPLIFSYWCLRRAYYLDMQVGKAAVSSTIYALAVGCIVVALRFLGQLTSTSAFLAMGLGSTLASLFALQPLRVSFWGGGWRKVAADVREVGEDLWSFGRWILIAYLANWLITMAYPILITLFIGTEFAAAFRTEQNLFLPLQQFLAAVTLLILPWLAKQQVRRGDHQVLKATSIAGAAAALMSVAYCGALVLFRRAVMDTLYANSFYTSFAGLIPYIALATALTAIPLVFGLGLRVLGQPQAILWSKGLAALALLVLGLPAISRFKATGLVTSLLLSAAVEAAVMLCFFALQIRRLAVPRLT